jgi:cob(I)alamin adenosyltransferase
MNAELHQARTVCRRAERIAVQLQEQAEINPQAVPFLNRLSDFFFVASRWIQFNVGAPETTWKKSGGLRDLKLSQST